MKTFVRVTIIIWTLAFVGGLITGKSAFSQDCKYRQTIQLDDKGKVLLDDEPTKIEKIKMVAQKKIAANPKIIFSLLTNKNTKYSDYILVLDQLKQANASKISIANPPGF